MNRPHLSVLILAFIFALFPSLSSGQVSFGIMHLHEKPGKAPDYRKSKYWAALPNKKDSADEVVKGLHNMQASAAVDVFYIHPTTYISGTTPNANVDDTSTVLQTDRVSVKFEASVFNGSCRIYAPRYRDVKFLMYFAPQPQKGKAFDIAYSDVRRAFIYYLKHYNKGRPFVIASHSQGTDHAIRLCKEFLDHDSVLNKRFVAAYLVGGRVYPNTFKSFCPCDSAQQTNCFVTWNAVRWGELTFFGKPVAGMICTNPLTWKRDHEYAPDSLNKGSVPFCFDRIDKHLFDAKCIATGLLWVHKPDNITPDDYPQIRSPFYHILEFNLFYMNIRENVKARVDAYFSLHEKKNLSANYKK